MSKKTTRILDLSFGNPAFLAAYWHGANAADISIRSDENMPYAHSSRQELVNEIVRAHQVIGNANVSGNFHIIVTAGATQALMAAMYAFREKGHAEFWAKVPYYFRFPSIASIVGCRWGDRGVQIVTRPNNPDGYSSFLVKRMERNVITDGCYNWPQYTNDLKKLDQIVSIFSLSKMTGHAGTRIGWAVVRDDSIAALMKSFVDNGSNGVSSDAQARAARLIQYEITNVQSKPLSVFSWAKAELERRWGALKASVPPEIELLNEVGMFAWCRLKAGGNAVSYMNGAYDVKVVDGRLMGSTQDRFRVNIGCNEEDFAEFIRRLRSK